MTESTSGTRVRMSSMHVREPVPVFGVTIRHGVALLTVFVLVVVLGTVVFFRRSLSVQTSQLDRSELLSVASEAARLVTEVEAMLVAAVAQRDVVLLPGKIPESNAGDVQLTLLDIRSRLRLLRLSRSEVSDAFLWFPSVDRVAGTGGTSSLRVFLEAFDDATAESLASLLALRMSRGREWIRGFWTNNGTASDVILHIHRAGPGTAILVLDAAAVEQSLEQSLAHEDTFGVVLIDGRLYAFLGEAKSKSFAQQASLEPGTLPRTGHLELNSRNYRVSSGVFVDGDLEIIVLREPSSLLRPDRQVFAYASVMIVLAGALATGAYMFMRHSFVDPLRDVLSQFSIVSHDSSEESRALKRFVRLAVADVRSRRPLVLWRFLRYESSRSHDNSPETPSSGSSSLAVSFVFERADGTNDDAAASELTNALHQRFGFRALPAVDHIRTLVGRVRESRHDSDSVAELINEARADVAYSLVGVWRSNAADQRNAIASSRAVMFGLEPSVRGTQPSGGQACVVDQRRLRRLAMGLLRSQRALAVELVDELLPNRDDRSVLCQLQVASQVVDLIEVVLRPRRTESKAGLVSPDSLNELLNRARTTLNPAIAKDAITTSIEQLSTLHESTPWIETLDKYINRHFSDPQLTLQHAADDLRFSYSYLSRMVIEHFGRSFTELVRQTRIREARRLLEQTHDSVESIGRQVGYVSVHTFIRAFRAETGTTPAAYRRQIGENA